MGSGSTCAAAMRQGRRVIGIEINRGWAEVARERLRADVSRSDYAARTAGQRALFRGQLSNRMLAGTSRGRRCIDALAFCWKKASQ